MDFEGRVIACLGETSGTSKTGKPWKKKEWVVETFGQYPRKVKLQCFNDRVDQLNIENGKDYVFSIDLESREFNGRWYTDVSVFRVTEMQSQPGFGQQQPPIQGGYQGVNPQQFGNTGPYGNNNGFGGGTDNFVPNAGEGDEDLPF